MISAAEPLLYRRITNALLWTAAFSYACGIFLSISVSLTLLPPTAPVAVGLVTILGYSKAADYTGAMLFFVLVPLLTLVLHRGGVRMFRSALRRTYERSEAPAVALLICVPFLMSPLLYVTSGKVGWVLLLPPVVAVAALETLRFWRSNLWLREMFAPGMRAYHALLFSAASSWLLFRYLATGRRIAHERTLVLELMFAAIFLALFWCVALLGVRLAELTGGRDRQALFRRICSGSTVFVLLPLVAIFEIPTRSATLATIAALLVVVFYALSDRRSFSPSTAWALAAYVLLPLIVYYVSYASTAYLSYWVDLFHRGESLGPASDYLRGKVPYRDVFALHGLLEDGLLDAWLMKIFGRMLAVTVARSAILGSLLAVSLWYLGVAIFDSIPLACVVVAMGAWTTAENDRTLFQVAAVTLLWIGLRRRSRLAAFAGGILAGIALFFSYDIGLYTIAGGIGSALLFLVVERFVEWDGLKWSAALSSFLVGIAAGALPFLLYLASRGALGDFFVTSFVTIPRIIDAVWSLPLPDIVSAFRGSNASLHALSDFILTEKFHLILSPLVIAVASVYVVQRLIRRRADRLDCALLVLTVFALVTQRTAFGRAEFRHQYFAAFLIGPMLVLLAILVMRSVSAAWRTDAREARPFLALLVLITASIAGALFWIPELVDARLDNLINYQRRVIHVLPDPNAEVVNDRIHAVSGYIDEQTPRGAPIYDFSNQPAFYFFADRPNPTRFYQVPIASPHEFQAEVIGDLERAKPRLVLRTAPERFDEFDGVPNTMRAQAVAAYLDDCYAFDRAIRGVEIWKRVGGRCAAPVANYVRRIHMPAPGELANVVRERMVFPIVGTTQGIGGAFWVSDLTLHNSLRDPIDVSVRFISASVRVDREIRLGKRQTVRWPDVVRTLFGQGEAVGTMWIGYRSGRAPVAVVKTADVAHAGRASIETPLTDADSAASGSDKSELTIVGIPANDGGRRLSIGIVNTGIVPAHYVVAARTRSGARVGKPLELYVPEDEVTIVRDPEAGLGVALDDTMTLRISMVAGRGVGFATFVDASGGTEFIPAIPSQK